MSAIASSTSKLTVSVHGEENYPFQAVLERLATAQVNGLTREKWQLNFNKLFAALCREYRGTFAAIYGGRDESGKPSRLPETVAGKLKAEVEKYILNSMQKHISVQNVSHVDKSFAFDSKFNCYERVRIVGRNVIALKEQRLGHILKVGEINRSIERLEEKPIWDKDRADKLFKVLTEHNAKIAELDKELAAQAALTN